MCNPEYKTIVQCAAFIRRARLIRINKNPGAIRNKANRQGLVTAFEKLAKLDGGKSGMFDSHPGSADRAKRMQGRLAKGG